jgi:hypothetical protein
MNWFDWLDVLALKNGGEEGQELQIANLRFQRGAHASGVWFAASRRNPRSQPSPNQSVLRNRGTGQRRGHRRLRPGRARSPFSPQGCGQESQIGIPDYGVGLARRTDGGVGMVANGADHAAPLAPGMQ